LKNLFGNISGRLCVIRHGIAAIFYHNYHVIKINRQFWYFAQTLQTSIVFIKNNEKLKYFYDTLRDCKILWTLSLS